MHTPGPWQASNHHALGGYPVRTAEPDTTPIAIVPDLTDARLIAEAPAMLEALRDWLANAEGGFLDEIPTFAPDVYQNNLVAKTVAILARIDAGAGQ